MGAYLVNGVILTLIGVGQILAYRAARRGLEQKLGRLWARLAVVLLTALMAGAFVVVWFDNIGRPAPAHAISFAAGIWMAGCAGAALMFLLGCAFRRDSAAAEDPPLSGRRQFLRGMAQAAALAPFGVAAYGTLLARRQFELREIDFPCPRLPAELEGVRLALITDIHFGPYLSLPELERVIAMANETRPHLALVTGDLITGTDDPLDTCLSRLAGLRAEAGTVGCLGNHEIYAQCEDHTASRGRELGIEFLRRQARLLEFGGARLNVVGFDYQSQRKPYLVGGGALVAPGAVNLLLSHNPDVFPKAAELGYDLVVGGHTHGGQVTVEILEQTVNIARFVTPFVAGLYRRGPASLYVSRGIGTINLPMRLGARPEVSLLRLRRA
jgi:predicted MPP superfamily phosphohydrolase